MIKPQIFKPKPAHQLYAYHRAKLGDSATEIEISKIIGVANETISRWKNIKGFNEWLEENVSSYRAPIKEMLEIVAIKNIDDYRFWEALAKKYGYLNDKGEEDKNNNASQKDVSAQERVKQIAEQVLKVRQA